MSKIIVLVLLITIFTCCQTTSKYTTEYDINYGIKKNYRHATRFKIYDDESNNYFYFQVIKPDNEVVEVITEYYSLFFDSVPKQYIYKSYEISNLENLNDFIVIRSEVYSTVTKLSKSEIVDQYFNKWGSINYETIPELKERKNERQFILAAIRKGILLETGCETGEPVIFQPWYKTLIGLFLILQ